MTVEEAVAALTAAAFTIDDEEASDYGRTIIHTFAGPFGADWDLDSAIEAVRTSRDRGWADNIFRHNLAIIDATGRLVCFDVPRPD